MRQTLLRRRSPLIVLVALVVMVPAIAFASHTFEDVPDSNTFHADIEWMAETGVTRGCNPPENTQYCPDRELIRGEEAAFFHRYDGYLRGSLEPRLLPMDCEAGEHAEFDGENWVCATSDDTGGPADLTVAAGDTVTVAASETAELTVSCEEGQVAVASSVNPSSADLDVSSETSGGDVTISVTNTGLDPIDVTPYAICATA